MHDMVYNIELQTVTDDVGRFVFILPVAAQKATLFFTQPGKQAVNVSVPLVDVITYHNCMLVQEAGLLTWVGGSLVLSLTLVLTAWLLSLRKRI